MSCGSIMNSVQFPKFVLSLWDDVVGPRVIKHWGSPCSQGCHEEDLRSLSDSEVNPNVGLVALEEDVVSRYIASHTVVGESLRISQFHSDVVRETCMVVPALNFVSQSAVFSTLQLSTTEQHEPCIYSFTVVLSHDQKMLFWDHQPLLVHITTKIANYLKLSLSKDPGLREDKKLIRWIGEADRQISITFHNSLRASPDFLLAKMSFIEISIPWALVISAMLTTGGCCCVVGRSLGNVNKVLEFLSVFLPDESMRKNSRRACENSSFCTGLFLQGMIEDKQGRRNISSCDVFLNDLPLTLVDLTRNGQVRFSNNIFEHRLRKERQQRQDEVNFIEGVEIQLPHTTEHVFRPYKEASRFVVWCLEQLVTQNAQKWDRIIRSFHRALLCKSAQLVSSIKQHQVSVQKSEKLAAKLRKTLSLTEPDLWLLAATAERIQPGISNVLAHL